MSELERLVRKYKQGALTFDALVEEVKKIRFKPSVIHSGHPDIYERIKFIDEHESDDKTGTFDEIWSLLPLDECFAIARARSK